MSNPAVIVLSSGRVGRHNIAIEDNVGEAIHLHFDDIRIDFSYDEFKKIVRGVKRIIEEIVSVDGFRCDDYDPVFLGAIAPWLIDLEKVEEDEVSLSDITVNKPRFYKHVNPKKLELSKDFKALRGDFSEVDQYNSFDHIGQSGRERLNVIVDSIKAHGYPYHGKKLVFFNNSNVIRDGQHRAAVMMFLYGDKKIPVVRLFFKNDKYSYPALRKSNRKKIKDGSYLIRYAKDRVLQHNSRRDSKRIAKWKKRNADLITKYQSADK